jgi:polysaccharide export outer membrane protein
MMPPIARRTCAVVLAASAFGAGGVVAQDARSSATTAAVAVGAPPITPPADYVIGPDDQLTIVFFQNKEMSSEVVVRPDGRISLPLLNDVEASGLTPDELRTRLDVEAKRFMQSPNSTVVVRQINSRRVSILGWVERPGTYPLFAHASVLELIATAGGLKEYANADHIVVKRLEGGRRATLKFNYKHVINDQNGALDISLKPGDIVVVP